MKLNSYKWFRGLLKASALTSVMFVMQACYGSPKDYYRQELKACEEAVENAEGCDNLQKASDKLEKISERAKDDFRNPADSSKLKEVEEQVGKIVGKIEAKAQKLGCEEKTTPDNAE